MMASLLIVCAPPLLITVLDLLIPTPLLSSSSNPADFQDPVSKLASWNEDNDDPCGWTGIKCSPTTNRIPRIESQLHPPSRLSRPTLCSDSTAPCSISAASGLPQLYSDALAPSLLLRRCPDPAPRAGPSAPGRLCSPRPLSPSISLRSNIKEGKERGELQFRLPWKPPLSSSTMASSPSAASQKNKQEDIDTRGAQRLCPSLLRTFWLHPDARVCSDISPAGIPVRHQVLDLAPMPRAMDLAPSQLHHPSRPPLAFHDIGCIIHFGRLRPSPDPTPGSSLASTVFS